MVGEAERAENAGDNPDKPRHASGHMKVRQVVSPMKNAGRLAMPEKADWRGVCNQDGTCQEKNARRKCLTA
jgi:hypothetical protein